MVELGAVLKQRRGDEADHAADKDVDADAVRALRLREKIDRDKWRGAPSYHRRELVAQGCAAVAQPAREALGDQCRLGAVLDVVWNQREHDRDEYQDRYRRAVQAEVSKAPDRGQDDSDHVDRLTPEPVGEVAEQWYGDE